MDEVKPQPTNQPQASPTLAQRIQERRLTRQAEEQKKAEDKKNSEVTTQQKTWDGTDRRKPKEPETPEPVKAPPVQAVKVEEKKPEAPNPAEKPQGQPKKGDSPLKRLFLGR